MPFLYKLCIPFYSGLFSRKHFYRLTNQSIPLLNMNLYIHLL